MSYQVLARKWRPRNFAEMVGQEHVLRALSNALDSGRLHHAFLFTGTRGVGKTTLARILAKSVNCEQGISATPCGVCTTCREIDEGRFVDLIEVDAASRTKVEDTRELLDNVQYAPTRGRYKVYLIDEVHMLSAHSFNALLKTLEEPPPHVKFLLATTDPQKLPITILSRCLQFNLRRLAPERIQAHLANILQQEAVEFEAAALTQIARAADGSMRDALSLLDQAIAYSGGKVQDAEVRAMLGTIEQQHVFDILDALAAGDGQQIMQRVQQLAQQVPDFAAVLAELISCLHNIALLQQIPDAYDQSMGDQQRLQSLVQSFSAEDVQLYYQIALTGRRDLPLVPDQRAGLEMVLLRMLAFRPQEAEQTVPGVKKNSLTAKPQTSPDADDVTVKSPPAEVIAKPEPVQPPTSPVTTSIPDKDDWHAIAAGVKVSGILRQLVEQSALVKRDQHIYHLALDPVHTPLLTREREQQLAAALSELMGENVQIQIETRAIEAETPAARANREQQERLQAAQVAIQNDNNVQNILDAFGARVNNDSVQPLDTSSELN